MEMEYAERQSVIVQTNDTRPWFSTFSKNGDPCLWSVRGQEEKTGWEVPSTKQRLPGCNWGSPHCSDSWCSMLGNQRVEMFPCRIFYCLLHLGQAFPFRPMLAVIPLLPVLLRLGGRQLSFNWRNQAQALVLANIHRPESLRMTLNPLLLTLHIDLPVKGTNKENWGNWDLDL